MPVSVTMPRLGESVTEGTVTRWLKAEGDHVEADEPLLEVSTDKVDTEVPSPASGTLLSIKVQEDETVEIGVELALIGDASEAGGDAGSAPAAPAAEPAQEQQAQAQQEEPAAQQAAEQAAPQPQAQPQQALQQVPAPPAAPAPQPVASAAPQAAPAQAPAAGVCPAPSCGWSRRERRAGLRIPAGSGARGGAGRARPELSPLVLASPALSLARKSSPAPREALPEPAEIPARRAIRRSARPLSVAGAACST